MSRIFLFLLCALCFSPRSDAAFVDHLKPAPGKEGNHSMRNIDFIYMINLDKRPEKFALSKSFLEPFGINPYRFSAVHGWQLSIEAINEVGLQYHSGMNALLGTTYVEINGKKIASHELTSEIGKTYFCHCMPLGAIGCALSHISILKDAYDSGYETVWVMEDDVEVLDNPHRLSELIDELDTLVGPENWDVLFTDYDYRIGPGSYSEAKGATKRPDMDCSFQARYADKYTQNIVISNHFRKMGARFGTASMIIRRSGIIKLLEFALTHHIYLPYDLENYLPDGIQRYGLTEDIVTNMLNPISDIGCESEGNKIP